MAILTKDERNVIFRVLATSKLDLAECELDGSDESLTIRHVPSESVIVIKPVRLSDEDNFSRERILHVKSRIGYDPNRDTTVRDSLPMIIGEVLEWAADVHEWVDTPDLWEISRSGDKIPGDLTPHSANTPFTEDEQGVISTQLKIIAESIKKTYELTAEQSAKLDEKFEEAEKASRRMGRKDWGLLFGGALLSLILCDAITPGIMGHILMMTGHGIGHLFGSPAAGGILSAGQD